MNWEQIVNAIFKDTNVDFYSMYFVCPLCGEPIYKEDYDPCLAQGKCPVCEEVII